MLDNFTFRNNKHGVYGEWQCHVLRLVMFDGQFQLNTWVIYIIRQDMKCIGLQQEKYVFPQL